MVARAGRRGRVCRRDCDERKNGWQNGGMIETHQATTEKRSEKDRKVHYSPYGVRTPAGRPKGVRNKLTNIRDAVLEAFETVGGPAYLVRLANGTQSDRAAFTGLVAKVLPTQIQANIDGTVKIELGWLGGRSVGATTAQIADDSSQVVEMVQDSKGVLRIKDPIAQADADTAAAPAAPEAAGGAER